MCAPLASAMLSVMRVLVTSATRHGATGEIADALVAGLQRRGTDADSRPVTDVCALDGYDAVVLGSAVYMGRWLAPARDFANRHASALAVLPVWLFSSGPLGPAEHLVPAGAPSGIEAIASATNARGHRTFAGRLDPATLGRAERIVARAVHAPNGDSRDWDAIDAFAGEIADSLHAAR